MITDTEYQDAKDTIEAFERDSQAFLFTAPRSVNGIRLTSKEMEEFHASLKEAIGEAFYNITSEAREIRDAYETQESRAHAASESTYHTSKRA